MLIPIHEEITREALATRFPARFTESGRGVRGFSPRALEIIIAANKKQDDLRGQIGHDEFHFDNNALKKSYHYITEQRGQVIATLLGPGILAAWIAFGRLLHAAQDFYSHTNYVSLWLNQFDGTPPPPPSGIDPVQKSLIDSPDLRSGKLYLPFDVFYFVPFLRKISLSLLPRDSHGHMNLDSPKQGPRFEYARAAAVKRTQYEFDVLRKILPPEMFARFTDL
jgi:hypothetical protein